MGIGGWNADSPALKAYLKRHTEVIGREPDRWASPITYASLQVLQQAIEKVGKIDRDAVIKELQTGTFDTIIGKIKLEGNIMQDRLGGRPVAGRGVLRPCADEVRGAKPAHRARSRPGSSGEHGLTRIADGDPPCCDSLDIALIVAASCSAACMRSIAMGLTLQYGVARIMNLAYGEFLVAAAFVAYLAVHRLRACSPLIGLLLVACRWLRRQLADLPRAADAAGRRARKSARPARGRPHPRDLRAAVRRAGHRARAVRRPVLQLCLSLRSRSPARLDCRRSTA